MEKVSAAADTFFLFIQGGVDLVHHVLEGLGGIKYGALPDKTFGMVEELVFVKTGEIIDPAVEVQLGNVLVVDLLHRIARLGRARKQPYV